MIGNRELSFIIIIIIIIMPIYEVTRSSTETDILFKTLLMSQFIFTLSCQNGSKRTERLYSVHTNILQGMH